MADDELLNNPDSINFPNREFELQILHERLHCYCKEWRGEWVSLLATSSYQDLFCKMVIYMCLGDNPSEKALDQHQKIATKPNILKNRPNIAMLDLVECFFKVKAKKQSGSVVSNDPIVSKPCWKNELARYETRLLWVDQCFDMRVESIYEQLRDYLIDN